MSIAVSSILLVLPVTAFILGFKYFPNNEIHAIFESF